MSNVTTLCSEKNTHSQFRMRMPIGQMGANVMFCGWDGNRTDHASLNPSQPLITHVLDDTAVKSRL